MESKKKIYLPGLIISVLTIISSVINIFVNNEYLPYFLICVLASILSFVFCIKHNNIFILISYLFFIVSCLTVTFITMNSAPIWFDDYMLLFPKAAYSFIFSLSIRDRNLLYNLIFSIIPLLLLTLGVFIKNKWYRFVVTAIFCIMTLIPIALSLYMLNDSTVVFFVINSTLVFVCISVTWYKFGLSQFVNNKPKKAPANAGTETEILYAQFTLEKLKHLFDNGEINEEEYNTQKSKIMNSL